MAGALEIGDQRGQTRSHQATLVDHRRQGRVVDLLAVRTPPGQTLMFLNAERHGFDVHLLDDTGRCRCRLQAVATIRTDFGHMGVATTVEQLRRKQGPFVTRVPGLPPKGTLGLSLRQRGWRRLDQIGRGGLGGRTGVLAHGLPVPAVRQRSHAGNQSQLAGRSIAPASVYNWNNWISLTWSLIICAVATWLSRVNGYCLKMSW